MTVLSLSQLMSQREQSGFHLDFADCPKEAVGAPQVSVGCLVCMSNKAATLCLNAESQSKVNFLPAALLQQPWKMPTR